MTDIPSQFISSVYPEAIDSDTNLFLAHDALRVILAETYDPSIDSTKIFVSGDTSNFPATGIITLTEQCSDPKDRAISFFYTTVTADTFEGLVAVPGFNNTIIRKSGICDITQNVMASHHNSLKDALINIEKFLGVQGTVDNVPLGSTVEGRLNFLKKLILTPRAWFAADKRVGLVPLEITFSNKSFRLGDGPIDFEYNLGDQIIDISLTPQISVTSTVPISAINVHVKDVDGGTLVKKYLSPGQYDVTLTVTNQYGSDSVTFEKFISARVEAPIVAVVDFAPTSDQFYVSGTRIIDSAINPAGPWENYPTIKSKTNKFISIFTDPSSNYLNVEDNTQRTNIGEELNLSLNAIDPIEEYVWILTDDLQHANEPNTNASYSLGGVYDLILRANTKNGAYRITKYAGAIDIIEDVNMFLFTISNKSPKTHEFGLVSQEFKSGFDSNITLDYDDSFLDGTFQENQAKFELSRNVGFAPVNTISSGNGGVAVIPYATGGATTDVTNQSIKILNFSGFSNLLTLSGLEITRPWNWMFLPFSSESYFLLGSEDAHPQSTTTSLSNQHVDVLSLGGVPSVEAGFDLVSANYVNGADELKTIPNAISQPKWDVHRTAIKNNTGYILRNESVGLFFRLTSFYHTEGIASQPLINIRKLQNMTGQIRVEGQLTNLSSGIYFFNNSGSVAAYDTTANVWKTLSVTPSVFKAFQDPTISGFDNTSNSLLVASDNDRMAYLSYDYTNNSFVKFNSVETTFVKLNPRPQGDQWLLTVY
jgi:PKD repeat protein